MHAHFGLLQPINQPITTIEQAGGSRANRTGGEVGGKGSIFVAGASGKASFDTTGTKSSNTSKTNTSSGLSRVVREIAKSDFVVFLDDFHYIPVEAQSDVARQLKAAGEQSVRICYRAAPCRQCWAQ